MAFVMGFFMSFFLTWINTGLDNGFVGRWSTAFGLGILIAFPISMLIAPMAARFVKRVVKD